MPPTLGLCLHGVYIFNPVTCTPEDLRQFLWAGVRVLDKEVKARGLSDAEVRRIVTGTFDAFHETGDVIWASLQRMKDQARTSLPTASPTKAAEPIVADREPPPPENKAVTDLRRAFLRKKHQVRAYREGLDRDLEALIED